MMLLAANTTTSQIRLRAEMTARTFDISNNLFSGGFPGWLVEGLAACKEDVTIILDVSFAATQHSWLHHPLCDLDPSLNGITAERLICTTKALAVQPSAEGCYLEDVKNYLPSMQGRTL